MPFLTQGKTDWKFIGIVVVLAVLVGSVILWWKESIPESEIIKIDEEEVIEFSEISFLEISEENIKKLNLDDKLVFLNPYKTEDKKVKFTPYYGEEKLVDGEVKYYEYKDNLYKTEDVEMVEDKYGDRGYYADLYIFNSQKNEHEDTGIGVGGSTILGYKDNLIILSSGWGRIGCCLQVYNDWFLIYDPASGKHEEKRIYQDRVIFDEAEKGEKNSIEFYNNVANAHYSILYGNNKLYLKANNEYHFMITRRSETLDDYYQLRIPMIAKADDIFGASVDNYYLIGDAQILEAKNEFRQVYLQKADAYNQLLENEQLDKGDWLSPLIGRTLNLIFAGEENMAWQNFETDFIKFSKNYPLPDQEKLDFQIIKEGVKNDLIKG